MAGKKTIMPNDVLDALNTVEFGFMREQLEREFNSAFLPFRPHPTFPACSG